MKEKKLDKAISDMAEKMNYPEQRISKYDPEKKELSDPHKAEIPKDQQSPATKEKK